MSQRGQGGGGDEFYARSRSVLAKTKETICSEHQIITVFRLQNWPEPRAWSPSHRSQHLERTVSHVTFAPATNSMSARNSKRNVIAPWLAFGASIHKILKVLGAHREKAGMLRGVSKGLWNDSNQ